MACASRCGKNQGRHTHRRTRVVGHARLKLTERVSAWGLAGFGTGDMTISFDDGAMDPVRTETGLHLSALKARGALLDQDEWGGMDLALKADTFFVRMESEKAANSTGTTGGRKRKISWGQMQLIPPVERANTVLKCPSAVQNEDGPTA